MNQLTNEKLNHACEQIKAIKTERFKNVSEEGIRMVWEVGEVLHSLKEDYESMTQLATVVAKKIDYSEIWLKKCHQTYEKWPEFEKIYLLPEGQSITVSKLWSKHLVSGDRKREEKEECENKTCIKCQKNITHKRHEKKLA